MFKRIFKLPGNIVDSEGRRYLWKFNRLYRINDAQAYDNVFHIGFLHVWFITIVSIVIFYMLFKIAKFLNLSDGLAVIAMLVPAIIVMAFTVTLYLKNRNKHIVPVIADEQFLSKLKYEKPKNVSNQLYFGIVNAVIAVCVYVYVHHWFLAGVMALSSAHSLLLYFCNRKNDSGIWS